MSPGPIQLNQATALTLMLGPNGSVGIQASRISAMAAQDPRCSLTIIVNLYNFYAIDVV